MQYTYFDYDDLNRLTAHRTKASVGPSWVWRGRTHEYDALGRIAKSGLLTWLDGFPPGSPTTVEHVYYGDHLLQNYDGTSTYGEVWHWAGIRDQQYKKAPLKSPNADTASQAGYNEPNNVTPQRRTYLSPTTEGDERNEWGQGRPQAKDASGSGSNWAVGTQSQPQNGNMNQVESRVMYSGTVSTSVDQATDAREKGRIGIFGSSLSYAGAYGRVVSESIGRDLNPLGRGDGNAYLAGWWNFGRIAPTLPYSISEPGVGNSVNNLATFREDQRQEEGDPGTGDPCNPVLGAGGECCYGARMKHNNHYVECKQRFGPEAETYLGWSMVSGLSISCAHWEDGSTTGRGLAEDCYKHCDTLLIHRPEWTQYKENCYTCCDEHGESWEAYMSVCCNPNSCAPNLPIPEAEVVGGVQPGGGGRQGGNQGGLMSAGGCCGGRNSTTFKSTMRQSIGGGGGSIVPAELRGWPGLVLNYATAPQQSLPVSVQVSRSLNWISGATGSFAGLFTCCCSAVDVLNACFDLQLGIFLGVIGAFAACALIPHLFPLCFITFIIATIRLIACPSLPPHARSCTWPELRLCLAMTCSPWALICR